MGIDYDELRRPYLIAEKALHFALRAGKITPDEHREVVTILAMQVAEYDLHEEIEAGGGCEAIAKAACRIRGRR